MVAVQHLSMTELEAGLDEIKDAPKDAGVVHLIVRRPETLGTRGILGEGQLDTVEGLVGDNWKARGSGQTDDGLADPECQITIMNSRVTDLVAQDKDRWHLAGDQFYVEMDISRENLPPGTRLVHWRSRTGSVRETAHRLRQVRGAIRRGRDEVRELCGRARTVPARHQHLGHSDRQGVSGRYGTKALVPDLYMSYNPVHGEPVEPRCLAEVPFDRLGANG